MSVAAVSFNGQLTPQPDTRARVSGWDNLNLTWTVGRGWQRAKLELLFQQAEIGLVSPIPGPDPYNMTCASHFSVAEAKVPIVLNRE